MRPRRPSPLGHQPSHPHPRTTNPPLNPPLDPPLDPPLALTVDHLVAEEARRPLECVRYCHPVISHVAPDLLLLVHSTPCSLRLESQAVVVVGCVCGEGGWWVVGQWGSGTVEVMGRDGVMTATSSEFRCIVPLSIVTRCIVLS